MYSRLIVLLVATVAACSGQEQAHRPAAPQDDGRTRPAAAASTAKPGVVQVEMRNVDLHLDADIVMRIHRLRGEMRSVRPGTPPVFDDMRSFTLRVFSAEVALDDTSLTALLRKYVFPAGSSPLKDVAVSVDGDRLRQTGKLHKAVDIPFSVASTPSVNPDGRLRLHTVSIKTAGIPAKGLMEALGVELDRVVKPNPERGVTADGNDLLLRLDRLGPPPRIEGRLVDVRVSGREMIQRFDDGRGVAPLVPPDRAAPNYMYYRGGVLRFGKLTMTDADMQLVDAEPRDPFDFYPDKYLRQLVAGYSRNTPSGGLVVFMPDYAKTTERTRLTPPK